MKTPDKNSLGRRKFFMTSGAVITRAGLGIPLRGNAEPGKKRTRGNLTQDLSNKSFGSAT